MTKAVLLFALAVMLGMLGRDLINSLVFFLRNKYYLFKYETEQRKRNERRRESRSRNRRESTEAEVIAPDRESTEGNQKVIGSVEKFNH